MICEICGKNMDMREDKTLLMIALKEDKFFHKSCYDKSITERQTQKIREDLDKNADELKKLKAEVSPQEAKEEVKQEYLLCGGCSKHYYKADMFPFDGRWYCKSCFVKRMIEKSHIDSLQKAEKEQVGMSEPLEAKPTEKKYLTGKTTYTCEVCEKETDMIHYVPEIDHKYRCDKCLLLARMNMTEPPAESTEVEELKGLNLINLEVGFAEDIARNFALIEKNYSELVRVVNRLVKEGKK